MERTLKTLMTTTLLMLPTAFGASQFVPSQAVLSDTRREELATSIVREKNAIRAAIQERSADPISIANANAAKLAADEARVFANLMTANVARALSIVKERGEAEIIADPIEAVKKTSAEIDLAAVIIIADNATEIANSKAADAAQNDLELFLSLCSRKSTSFDDVLKIAIAFNPWSIHMNRREHMIFLSDVVLCNTFSESQVQILKGLLPLAIPAETQDAVAELRKLGDGYGDMVDALRVRIHRHLCMLHRLGLDQ